jgi:outer membrane protein
MSARNAALCGVAALSLVLIADVEAQASTLSDAAALAYETNPALRSQRAALSVADEGYVQARAGYGPQVQANGGDTYEKVRGGQSIFGPTGQQSANNGVAGLQVAQSLYSGGRNHAAVDEAEANILAQRETVRQAEIQVLQQTVAAYVGVRRDMAVLSVYRDTVQALERQLKQVEAEYSVRQVTQTDVDETRGRLSLARTNVAQAQAQLEVSRSQYLQVVGENPGDLTPEPSIEVFPNLDAAFDSAEANNPGLNIARYEEEGARARVASARANFLPSVTAQVSLQRSAVQPYSVSLGAQTALIGQIAVTQPLYNSGLYSSQVREAQARVSEGRANIEQQRRAAVQSVSQAWSSLIAARASISSDEAAVTATERAFYGVRREQPFDLRQPIDVLNAEQELNSAQVRLVQDRYNEYVARIGLLAAAGVLDVNLLSPHTTPVSPAKSFNKVRHKGDVPWTDVLQKLDSIGVPAVEAPRPAVRDGEDRRDFKPPMLPPPTEADRTAPLSTATSIMEAEAAENGQSDVSTPPPNAPADRCVKTGGRKIGDCLPTDGVQNDPSAKPKP